MRVIDVANKLLAERVEKLFEKVLEKKPSYKSDLLILYTHVLSENYAKATDYLLSLIMQFASDPDLKEYKTEIADIIIDILLEAGKHE